MLHPILLLAVTWPSSIDHVQAAALPHEPQAIAIYVVLGWSVWLVWMGNRKSGVPSGTEDGETSDSTEDADGTSAQRSKAEGVGIGDRKNRGTKKLSRSQRRRRGYIDWIQ